LLVMFVMSSEIRNLSDGSGGGGGGERKIECGEWTIKGKKC
jgi:hypothetical protein